MENWTEYTAKSVDEALTEALIGLKTTSDNIEYKIIEKESYKFFGLIHKPARIKVRYKKTVESIVRKFLEKVLNLMNIEGKVEILYFQEKNRVDINLIGNDMGVLIGKRGQTLDALQYLISVVLYKENGSHIKVKLDTENYRERRRETLENLARNIAYKVKKTKVPVLLEPMNPYERRTIHSALQNDKLIETRSEGEEPYRRVKVKLRKSYKDSEKE